jgi:signal transduction histidine kinase
VYTPAGAPYVDSVIGGNLPSAAPTGSKNPPSPDRYPVVLVEDDDATRNLVTRFLSAQGYAVHPFPTAPPALDLCAEVASPVLLTDNQLPGMSGLDLIEQLQLRRTDFEAVIFTAYADVDTLVRSMRLGCFRCVLKPFHNDELVAAVAGAANRLWLRLDLRARSVELEKRNEALEAMVSALHESERLRTLGERMASIGRLAAGVAHEINTPLATLIANLDTIGEGLRDVLATAEGPRVAEAVDALADARQAADRVRTVVRDLKTFSRPDDEKVGPVDLRRVIEGTLNMAWTEIRHRARLVKDFGPTPKVLGNEARIGQVVLNLVLNAAHAIEPGDAANNEIRVVTRTRDGQAVIEVRDTGTGMPPDVKARIFEPFFTTKGVGQGTGLGLSIVHGIVTAMTGSLEVDSELGKGSAFRVILPPALVREVAVPEITPTPTYFGDRPRVLVVDDEPLYLQSLRRLLGKTCDVSTAASARAARDALSKGTFDLVLCDLMMPEETGMDLYAQLARTKPAIAEAMVFMTGGTFTSRAREFLEQVPNLRFEKPFDAAQLRAVIRERMLQRH